MQVNNVYLAYTYRGSIKIKHGTIDISDDLPFTVCQFYADDGKRHTNVMPAPYKLRFGRIWGYNADQITAIIRERYRERIKELESSNALSYAEMIVEEEI